MRIDRLEVSGGFLNGLCLTFTSGLNVLIGPRGAGKTSVLELVRFALGLKATTTDADQEANDQARAVLGAGTVTLYCSFRGEPFVLSRTSLDNAPSASATYAYVPPLIVSQNEIEAIGLDPKSRRDILDRLIDPAASSDSGGETRAQIATFQKRLERVRQDRADLADRITRLEALPSLLAEAEKEQVAATAQAEAAKPLQDSIASRSDALGKLRAAADAYRLVEEALSRWSAELEVSQIQRPLPSLPSAEAQDRLVDGVTAAENHVRAAVEELTQLRSSVQSARAQTVAQQSTLQTSLKADAEQLEELQKGAGEIGRRVSALRQQLQERDALVQRLAELDDEIRTATTARDQALDEAELRSHERYELRRQAAATIAREFKGKIEVRVARSGEHGAYEAALVQALQGSNLQYKALAAEVAAKMSPRELVAAVEAGAPDQVTRATQASSDRALRLIAHLQQRSMAELLLAPLEDSVDFALLDGQEYKTTQNLSMGQRCTVVLPLLLAEERDAILLDQPEDHLDNAFIVETLVEAIRERARAGQVIVATHNANIPVLGEADQVVVLASDGRHGFVTTSEPLDAESSVEAITTLMEGGRQAFARRAAFYSSHS